MVTNKSDNKFKYMQISSSLRVKGVTSNKDKLQTDALLTQLVNNLDEKGLKYFNFSKEEKFGHTLMMFKENDKDLQNVLLDTLRYSK